MAFRVGILAVIGGILISIMVGVYAFDQAKTVPVYAVAGELIQVGPVSYVIEYDAFRNAAKGGNRKLLESRSWSASF